MVEFGEEGGDFGKLLVIFNIYKRQLLHLYALFVTPDLRNGHQIKVLFFQSQLVPYLQEYMDGFK